MRINKRKIAGIYDDKCDKVVFDRQIKDRFGVYGEISLEDLLKGKEIDFKVLSKKKKEVEKNEK